MSMAEAIEALGLWEGGSDLRLIKDRENAVYSVLLSGRRAALRLHRPGYQTAAAIRSELVWGAALHRAGLAVPPPMPSRSGAVVEQLSTGRLVSTVGWLEGAPLGSFGVPFSEPVSAQIAAFRAAGHLIARIHSATDALSLPPDFSRPSWDLEGLLGEAPLWGRFWDNPALRPEEQGLLLKVRDCLREKLAHLLAEGGDFGLIHADLMRENLLRGPEGLALIDFDDSGFGFRLYDLGTLMIQNLEEPAYSDLLAAAVAGYEEIRPLGDHAALVPDFVALRTLASCGWIVPRTAAEDPRRRLYAERALAQARGVLGRA